MVGRTRIAARQPLLVRPTWRGTNLALLAALLLAFATGVAAVATGSAAGTWVVVAHGVVGLAVVALVPAKRRVVAGGWRRRRPGRWMSVALAALAVGALASGIASSTGLVRTIGGLEPLWVHIALALLLGLPLAGHVLARPVRPRAADLTRRTVLRAGVLGALAGGIYAGLEGAVALTGLRGTQRRFTGSHAVDPAAMPVTSWLDDAVQQVDGSSWRLTVSGADGPRELTRAALVASGTTTVRATLDCTSGWYATRDWTGVPVARLIGRVEPAHRSVRVRSLTGYDRYLPLSDLPHLLLALEVDGRPLTAGHGFPARLVAPGRRGFWWVKWVVAVEPSRRPWWAQSPFPLD
jgi:hypothetical protein